VYISGLSSDLRNSLASGGVSPYQSNDFKLLKYYHDFDTALGQAEDYLLSYVYNVAERERRLSERNVMKRNKCGVDDGFLYALGCIDDQVRGDAIFCTRFGCCVII